MSQSNEALLGLEVCGTCDGSGHVREPVVKKSMYDEAMKANEEALDNTAKWRKEATAAKEELKRIRKYRRVSSLKVVLAAVVALAVCVVGGYGLMVLIESEELARDHAALVFDAQRHEAQQARAADQAAFERGAQQAIERQASCLTKTGGERCLCLEVEKVPTATSCWRLEATRK